MSDELRERLGRVVREAWVAYCREMGDANERHLASWDDLNEYDKEVDRRIGMAVRAEIEGTHALLPADGITPDGLARLRAVVEAGFRLRDAETYAEAADELIDLLDAVTPEDMGR